MPDETQATPVVEVKIGDKTEAAPSAETKNTDTPSPEITIPKSRFDEVSKKLRELEADAAKKDKALREADEQRKAEQGEWQKLAEERKTQLEQLSSKSELADRLSEIVAKQLDAELATWPEEAQPLVLPTESPLLQRIESADRARPIAQKLLAAQGNGTPQGMRYPAQGTGGNGTPQTTKDIAMRTLNKAYAPRKPIS